MDLVKCKQKAWRTASGDRLVAEGDEAAERLVAIPGHNLRKESVDQYENWQDFFSEGPEKVETAMGPSPDGKPSSPSSEASTRPLVDPGASDIVVDESISPSLTDDPQPVKIKRAPKHP